MNKPTLAALKKSIAHWKRLSTGKQAPGESTSATDCALCAMFFYQCDKDQCAGCPVSESTGFPRCIGSPYDAVMDTMDEFGEDSPEFRTEAVKELEFLRSLLPL